MFKLYQDHGERERGKSPSFLIFYESQKRRDKEPKTNETPYLLVS